MSMDFYERVKDAVKQKGYSLIPFLNGLGINYDSYKSTKRAGNLPRADEAYKIASALNVSLEYLLTGKDTDVYKEKYEKLVGDIRDFAGKIS